MITINNILRESIEFDTNGHAIIKDKSVNEALREMVGPDSRGGFSIKMPKNVNFVVIGNQTNVNQ